MPEPTDHQPERASLEDAETTRRPAARTPSHGRATMPAGKVLIVMVVALLVWALLYAPTLKRSSEAQPLGTRRTVSLWILGPMAAISNVLQLTKATDAVSSALGKDPDAAPGGDLDIPLPTVEPGASPSPKPTKPVTKTTPMRKPTPQDKLRVVVVGDSLAQGLGVYMERQFRPAARARLQAGPHLDRPGAPGLLRLAHRDGGDRGRLPPGPGDRDDRATTTTRACRAPGAAASPTSAASNGPRATRTGSNR